MLGKAFGIHENNVRTYAEAEIRAGYAFHFFICKIFFKVIQFKED